MRKKYLEEGEKAEAYIAKKISKTPIRTVLKMASNYYAKRILVFSPNTRYISVKSADEIFEKFDNVSFINNSVRKKIEIALNTGLFIDEHDILMYYILLPRNLAFIDTHLNVILDIEILNNDVFMDRRNKNSIPEVNYFTINIDPIELDDQDEKNFSTIFEHAMKTNHPVIKTENKDVFNMVKNYL